MHVYTRQMMVETLIIPHATSCGGYNVFYPSVSQSVSPSVLCFSCQRNSSETVQQNFLKHCTHVYCRTKDVTFDEIGKMQLKIRLKQTSNCMIFFSCGTAFSINVSHIRNDYQLVDRCFLNCSLPCQLFFSNLD